MAIVRKRYLYLFGPFVRALRDSWGGRWGERAAKEKQRRERIYSENEAKGERSPLVVTGLLCVSVEKKHAARVVSARITSAFRRRSHEASRSNW